MKHLPAHAAKLPGAVAARFAHVDAWVFDLDNTLYPAGSDVWPKIDQRITLFMVELFGLDGASSRALQKYYYERYGTTLRGLMSEHDVTAEEFLEFVHDIDRSSLVPDHSLARAIARLPGRKLILTNGSREHALRTAERLGIDRLFEDVFDIVAADLLPKPHAETYEKFFLLHDVAPHRAAMFEDMAKNLLVPHARGMLTTLVTPKAGDAVAREEWELEPGRQPHIDFVTDDLTSFLEALAPDAQAR